jgi:IS5 family transposase
MQLMFRVLVLQALYTLSDDQTEYQLRDRLSFMRFVGLALQDAVPDAKTIWLYREQLTRVGARAKLFARFNAMLAARGFLAMGGQIVDATVVEARRPRLTKDEKQTLRDGGTPSVWSKARTRQTDRDGRWTIKRARKVKPPGGAPRQAAAEIAVPMFGYKAHLGVARVHGFIRRFVVTDAARHDGAQLGAVLDSANTGSGVRADTACRSKANLDLLDRRGRRPEFQRARPRGRPMPAHIARGNATRARVLSLIEHVFAAEKRRMGLVVRCISLARATARITLTNLAYNMRRLVWLQGRAVPA